MSVKLLPLVVNPDNNFQIEIQGFGSDDQFYGIVEKNGSLFAQVETYEDDEDDVDEEEFDTPKDLLEIFA